MKTCSLLTPEGVGAVDEGPHGRPVVVMVGSLGSTLSVYDGPARSLLDAGYRVIRVDLRGHGRSAAAPVAADSLIDDLADDIAKVLDRAGVDAATVVGCSVGGLASVAFAARHRVRCNGLVLTGAAATFAPPAMWEERAALVSASGMAALADAAVARWVTETTSHRNGASVQRVRQDLLDLAVEVFVVYADALRTADVTMLLRDVESPSLVIVGDGDLSSPVEQARMLDDGLARSSLEIVADARHLVQLDQPNRFDALLLEFLADL